MNNEDEFTRITRSKSKNNPKNKLNKIDDNIDKFDNLHKNNNEKILRNFLRNKIKDVLIKNINANVYTMLEN